MLRVALVNPGQSAAAYSQPPLGLALIGAVLEKAGHSVSIIDGNVLRLSPEAAAGQVKNVDIVGLTAVTPTINTAIAIAHQLKKATPALPIILGGPHATLLPEETLAAALEIDIVVRGEAEDTIVELLQALEMGQSMEKIAGITYRREGQVVSNPPRTRDTDLEKLPFLAYHLLPWSKYRPHPPHGRYMPFAAVVTSRGCPYHCSYCSKPIFGNKFRGQSAGRVVEELAYQQKRFGIKEFAFYDDVFTLDKKRTHAICDEMQKRKMKAHWSCESRVNLVDAEMLKHMKQAGCYSIAYGIESGSPEMLKTLDKGITLEQIKEAVRMTRRAGIEAVGYFMVGSPGETPQTIQQTIDFAKKLKLDFAQFAVTTPFPRTRLYELYMAGSNARDSVPWDAFAYTASGGKSPVFESDALDRDAIQQWAKQAHREFYLRPGYVWQRVSRIRSLGDFKINTQGLVMLLRSTGKKA